MSVFRNKVFLLILIFTSNVIAKPLIEEPFEKKDEKVISEDESIPPPKKVDNATSSLQGKWEKFATEKLHKKHGKHHITLPVSPSINMASLEAADNNTQTSSKPEENFELTKHEERELSLELISESPKNDDSSVSNSSVPNDFATEVTVYSPPLLLKQSKDTENDSTAVASTDSPTTEAEVVASNLNDTADTNLPAVPEAVVVASTLNVTEAPESPSSLLPDEDEEDIEDEDEENLETSYKDKVRPSFQPYIEEILSTGKTTGDETPALSPPVILKQEEYVSSQNALMPAHPFGHLPSFSEKELGRLRLNHWRVKQILKGSVDTQAEKLGLPGSRKEILQNKYPYPAIGQKRAATSSGEASYMDDSAVDSLSALLTSADQDNTPGQFASSPPSNLRTFFSWFSTPQKSNEQKYDQHRAKQLKAQQAILPLALNYNGDFLFW